MLTYLDTGIGFAVVMLLLSLIITIVVQASVVATGLRGRSLRVGISRLLEVIHPDLKGKGDEIARRIVMHPGIAAADLFGRPRPAVAIRVEELLRVLSQIAREDQESSAQRLDKGTKEALDRLLGANVDLAARFNQLAAEIASEVKVDAAMLRGAATRAIAGPHTIVTGVADWFDTVMDRTTQRFVASTRLIGVVAAIALTLFLRLDALALLNRIWSEAGLRSELTGLTQEVLALADTVVSQTGAGQELATTALQRTVADLDSSVARQLGEIPPALRTRAEGDGLIAARIADPAERELALRAFRERFAEQSDTLLTRLSASSRAVREVLSDGSLALFPSPLPDFTDHWLNPARWLGGLVSVMLLSLGAPFWFNLLKRMAELRPAVARKIGAETEGRRG